MANEDKFTDQQLSDLSIKVENEVVKKLKKRFIGTMVGLSVIFAALAYFGWSTLVNTVTDKVVKKITNEKFKQEVIVKVTKTISSESNEILNHMEKNKLRSDQILREIKIEHEGVLDAANHEFRRTADVLRKVREKYSQQSDK